MEVTRDRIGKYDLLGELGRGGMGTVYKCHDPIIDRDVAIKVIHKRALNDPSSKKRFYREARSAGRLTHPNITIIHEVGEAEGRPYLVMEYLEGSDLRSMLREETPLTCEEKLSIAKQICSGLHYAHEHEIIHRDIKPENIRVLPNGTVKIMDFGIARILSETTILTNTNVSIGTPHYMAPEQVRGEKIDHRVDIFSFGVLFYELLTGINPFEGENVTTIIYKILNKEPRPLELVPEALCKALQRIVSTCLAKDLDTRYACFGDVLRDLQAIPKKEAAPEAATPAAVCTPPPPSPPQRDVLPGPSAVSEKKPASPHRWWWITLGIVLAVGLAASAYLAFLSDFASQRAGDPPETQTSLSSGAFEVAAVTVTPSEASLDVGEKAFFDVELRNASGERIEPGDLTSSAVQWTSTDTTIAVVSGVSMVEGGSLGSVVTGRKRGGTTIAVVVDQIVRYVPIKVGVSIEVMAEAVQRYAEAGAHLHDASLLDSALLATFEAVRDSFGYALTEDRLVDLEQTIQQLSALIATFIGTEERAQSDTLTIFQKRASWQAYVDRAFRQSPATQFAAQRIREIDEIVQRAATLEQDSFTICDQTVPGESSGSVRICQDSAIGDQFAPGTSVYFNARVIAPQSATIRWEWLGPDGSVVKQYRTGIPDLEYQKRVSGAQGYRIWNILSGSDTRQPGTYEIRIYNEEDFLIERRTFTIRDKSKRDELRCHPRGFVGFEPLSAYAPSVSVIGHQSTVRVRAGGAPDACPR